MPPLNKSKDGDRIGWHLNNEPTCTLYCAIGEIHRIRSTEGIALHTVRRRGENTRVYAERM